jgi:hypothetical protein
MALISCPISRSEKEEVEVNRKSGMLRAETRRRATMMNRAAEPS